MISVVYIKLNRSSTFVFVRYSAFAVLLCNIRYCMRSLKY